MSKRDIFTCFGDSGTKLDCPAGLVQSGWYSLKYTVWGIGLSKKLVKFECISCMLGVNYAMSSLKKHPFASITFAYNTIPKLGGHIILWTKITCSFCGSVPPRLDMPSVLIQVLKNDFEIAVKAKLAIILFLFNKALQNYLPLMNNYSSWESSNWFVSCDRTLQKLDFSTKVNIGNTKSDRELVYII